MIFLILLLWISVVSLLYSLPPCGLSGSKSSGHWGSPLVVLPGLALPPTKKMAKADPPIPPTIKIGIEYKRVFSTVIYIRWNFKKRGTQNLDFWGASKFGSYIRLSSRIRCYLQWYIRLYQIVITHQTHCFLLPHLAATTFQRMPKISKDKSSESWSSFYRALLDDESEDRWWLLKWWL